MMQDAARSSFGYLHREYPTDHRLQNCHQFSALTSSYDDSKSLGSLQALGPICYSLNKITLLYIQSARKTHLLSQ